MSEKLRTYLLYLFNLLIYFWNKTLHVSDSSSVRHQEFFTVYTAMVYVIQLASRVRTELLASSANLYDIHLLLCVQWKTPDDGQRKYPKHVEFYSKNKFEKLVHLVGFIIRIYHYLRSHERQICTWVLLAAFTKLYVLSCFGYLLPATHYVRCFSNRLFRFYWTFFILYCPVSWLANTFQIFIFHHCCLKRFFIRAYLEFIFFLAYFSRERIMLMCVLTFLVISLLGLVFSPEEGSSLLPKPNAFSRKFYDNGKRSCKRCWH